MELERAADRQRLHHRLRQLTAGTGRRNTVVPSSRFGRRPQIHGETERKRSSLFALGARPHSAGAEGEKAFPGGSVGGDGLGGAASHGRRTVTAEGDFSATVAPPAESSTLTRLR